VALAANAALEALHANVADISDPDPAMTEPPAP
jgi:hypothetical protein